MCPTSARVHAQICTHNTFTPKIIFCLILHIRLCNSASLAANWMIDGAKVAVTKPVSNNFQVNHVILMGSQQEYHFGATYIGEPKFGQPEVWHRSLILV